ncbi:hypothetical protein BHE74_00005548 [Ensete ventricosum]|nr:hypothetical protein BHE74_00005548 [Ensete ventricosum]
MEAGQGMAQEGKWETFEEEEEASLLSGFTDKSIDVEGKMEGEGDDFEFRVSAGGGLLEGDGAAVAAMCAADEVFFKGHIMPLRPSVDNGGSRRPSRCGSRSDSMDRCSTAIASLGFDTSRSNSSNSSSNCVSRSHSSNSARSSNAFDLPRSSLSNNFYTHPSPKPQLRHARKASASRRSTASAPPGWGIFWLGLIRPPHIELYDLRSRRSSTGTGERKSDADAVHEKKSVRSNEDGSASASASARNSSSSRRLDVCDGENKVEKKVTRLVGRGLSCKCTLDAVEPRSMAGKKKQDGASLRRADSMYRSRIFEWLEELSIAKATTGSRDSGGGVH